MCCDSRWTLSRCSLPEWNNQTLGDVHRGGTGYSANSRGLEPFDVPGITPLAPVVALLWSRGRHVLLGTGGDYLQSAHRHGERARRHLRSVLPSVFQEDCPDTGPTWPST